MDKPSLSISSILLVVYETHGVPIPALRTVDLWLLCLKTLYLLLGILLGLGVAVFTHVEVTEVTTRVGALRYLNVLPADITS